MKKSVLNWIGRTVAVTAIAAAAATTGWAQSASVDSEFARELKLVEALKVYNAQLKDQLAAQSKANSEIQASIESAKKLEPQVAPLLAKMLTALDKFVKADLPFKLEERQSSINMLKNLMVDTTASTSVRFRSIMDIYSAEMEYGTTVEAYDSVLNIDGQETPVDMLRVGRIGLYYQTKDQKKSAMYDNTNKTWKLLPDSSNRNIRKAIKVAAKTVAPELLSLTINAPEGA